MAIIRKSTVLCGVHNGGTFAYVLEYDEEICPKHKRRHFRLEPFIGLYMEHLPNWFNEKIPVAFNINVPLKDLENA